MEVLRIGNYLPSEFLADTNTFEKKNRGYGITKQNDKDQRRSIDVKPATQEGYDAPF